jgi:hypothetical protein
MRIREYKPEDLAAIKKLHEGHDFDLPNLMHPLVIVKKCLVDDDERVRMAAFGRLHISAILAVDPTYATPELRLEAVKELQKDMDATAAKFGLDIATTQADGRFAERLKEDLGWTRGYGQMFYRSIP